MSAIWFVFILVIAVSLVCVVLMTHLYFQEKKHHLRFATKIKLYVSGVLAFLSDSIGVGSFAINIACAKQFKTFTDYELPAVINCAQVIPGLLEAMLFMRIVDVDHLTLITLVIAASIGGVIGVNKICRLNPQGVRLLMCLCFPLIIFFLLSEHYHWMPIGGHAHKLRGLPLFGAAIGIACAGALAALGVGFFASVQGVLFVAGMAPLAAFPIMTMAGALQQPLTTYVFLKKSNIPMRKCAWLIFGGLLGVGLAIPMMSHLSVWQLHLLLISVLSYNTLMMGLSYLKGKREQRMTLLKAS